MANSFNFECSENIRIMESLVDVKIITKEWIIVLDKITMKWTPVRKRWL